MPQSDSYPASIELKYGTILGNYGEIYWLSVWNKTQIHMYHSVPTVICFHVHLLAIVHLFPLEYIVCDSLWLWRQLQTVKSVAFSFKQSVSSKQFLAINFQYSIFSNHFPAINFQQLISSNQFLIINFQ